MVWLHPRITQDCTIGFQVQCVLGVIVRRVGLTGEADILPKHHPNVDMLLRNASRVSMPPGHPLIGPWVSKTEAAYRTMCVTMVLPHCSLAFGSVQRWRSGIRASTCLTV